MSRKVSTRRKTVVAEPERVIHQNPQLRRELTSGALDSSENDDDCLEILTRYNYAEFLGNGSFGIALKLYHATETVPIVIKIMTRVNHGRDEPGDSIAEISKSIRIDKLIAQHSRAFSRTFGWIQCGPVSVPNWIDAIAFASDKLEFDPQVDPCYYLVTEYGNGVALSAYTFATMRACQGFVFEVIYALMDAHDKHEFHHNDLHCGNVIVTLHAVQARNYRVGDTSYVVKNTFRPTFIDFGMSTLGPAEELFDAKTFYIFMYGDAWSTADMEPGPIKTYLDSLDDFHFKNEYLEFLIGNGDLSKDAVLREYKKHLFKDNESGLMRDVNKLLTSLVKQQRIQTVKKWVGNVLQLALKSSSFQAVLSSDFFADLRELIQVQKTKRRKTLGCMICGQVATQCIEQAPSYRFCHLPGCSTSIGPIGMLLND